MIHIIQIIFLSIACILLLHQSIRSTARFQKFLPAKFSTGCMEECHRIGIIAKFLHDGGPYRWITDDMMHREEIHLCRSLKETLKNKVELIYLSSNYFMEHLGETVLLKEVYTITVRDETNWSNLLVQSVKHADNWIAVRVRPEVKKAVRVTVYDLAFEADQAIPFRESRYFRLECPQLEVVTDFVGRVVSSKGGFVLTSLAVNSVKDIKLLGSLFHLSNPRKNLFFLFSGIRTEPVMVFKFSDAHYYGTYDDLHSNFFCIAKILFEDYRVKNVLSELLVSKITDDEVAITAFVPKGSNLALIRILEKLFLSCFKVQLAASIIQLGPDDIEQYTARVIPPTKLHLIEKDAQDNTISSTVIPFSGNITKDKIIGTSLWIQRADRNGKFLKPDARIKLNQLPQMSGAVILQIIQSIVIKMDQKGVDEIWSTKLVQFGLSTLDGHTQPKAYFSWLSPADVDNWADFESEFWNSFKKLMGDFAHTQMAVVGVGNIDAENVLGFQVDQMPKSLLSNDECDAFAENNIPLSLRLSDDEFNERLENFGNININYQLDTSWDITVVLNNQMVRKRLKSLNPVSLQIIMDIIISGSPDPSQPLRLQLSHDKFPFGAPGRQRIFRKSIPLDPKNLLLSLGASIEAIFEAIGTGNAKQAVVSMSFDAELGKNHLFAEIAYYQNGGTELLISNLAKLKY